MQVQANFPLGVSTALKRRRSRVERQGLPPHAASGGEAIGGAQERASTSLPRLRIGREQAVLLVLAHQLPLRGLRCGGRGELQLGGAVGCRSSPRLLEANAAGVAERLQVFTVVRILLQPEVVQEQPRFDRFRWGEGVGISTFGPAGPLRQSGVFEVPQ